MNIPTKFGESTAITVSPTRRAVFFGGKAEVWNVCIELTLLLASHDVAPAKRNTAHCATQIIHGRQRRRLARREYGGGRRGYPQERRPRR